jgi:hypothetical protein
MTEDRTVPAAAERPRPRRRFRRGRALLLDAPGVDHAAALEAELVLLREENARLRGAQHQRADVARLLARARSPLSAEAIRASLSDDAAQMLVDGLVIRESLLEICAEIERSMVAFEARLTALASAADHQPPEPDGNGHGPAGGNGNGNGHPGNGNGHPNGNGHGPTTA